MAWSLRTYKPGWRRDIGVLVQYFAEDGTRKVLEQNAEPA